MFASIMRGAKYFTQRDRRNVVFLLCTHTEVVNYSIVRDCVLIEFTGEKTHYFNGGMIACRCTVRM